MKEEKAVRITTNKSQKDTYIKEIKMKFMDSEKKTFYNFKDIITTKTIIYYNYTKKNFIFINILKRFEYRIVLY